MLVKEPILLQRNRSMCQGTMFENADEQGSGSLSHPAREVWPGLEGSPEREPVCVCKVCPLVDMGLDSVFSAGNETQ